MAVRGEGATLNGGPIRVSDEPLFHGAVETLVPRRQDFWVPGLGDKLDDFGVSTMTLGSPILASILVATGELNGTVLGVATAWDCAASKILVEEAGGHTSNLLGDEQRYDQPVMGFVCGNVASFDDLLGLIRACGVQEGRSGLPGLFSKPVMDVTLPGLRDAGRVRTAR
jgi:fructose-1,6-bisphosphatase/inositol monophosphatase family enzyme